MNRQPYIIRIPLIVFLLTSAFAMGLLEPDQRISIAKAQGPTELLQLQTKAQSQGTVRVIVELNLQTELIGQMTSQVAQNQQLQLSNIQETVVQQLVGQNVSEIARFDYIPFVALEVDADALVELAALPQVISITEDRQMSFSLTSSLPTIEVDDLHAAGFTGVGQTVAILDSGVSKTHSAFSGRVVSEACYSTTNGSYNTVSTCPGGVASSTASGSGIDCTAAANAQGLTNAANVCSHGTHVAGIAAGNGGGVVGIAKDADIIAIQVASLVTTADNITIFSTDTLQGLQRVLALHNSGNYNVAAVNLSLGGGQYSAACDSIDPATKAAFDNLRSVGIAPIVATGNEGYTNSIAYPACLSSGISIGATADHNQIVDFSNIASFIDLLAPGFDVVSSLPGNSSGSKSGTSMATPMVAGVWTALKEAVPNASVDEILVALKSTGTLVDDNTRYNVSPLGDTGGGTQDIPRINANQALNKLKVDIAVSQAVTPLIAGPGDTITYTLAFTNSGSNTASTVYLTNILPSEIIGENYQANGISVSSIGGGSNYVWQVDNLAANASGSLIVTGQVASGVTVGSNINNVFTASTTLYDTDSGNDNATAIFSVCGNNLSVNNANDSGSGSLRQAIADACDGTTITFADNQTINLNSTLTINKDLTINGSGKTVTISGNNSVRVFDIASDNTVVFSNFSIISGASTGDGAGILNAANLTLQAMLIRNNNTSGSGQGGGIYSSGNLTVKNSTIATNTATGNGGGLFGTANATLKNNTFSHNQGAIGGGIHVGGGILSLSNSVIANSSSGGDCTVSSGTFTDDGHNLIEDGTCISAGTSISGDPLLASLGNYGGDTQTLALLPGSPAIDAGNTATCEANDQRDENRVNDCDIGAVESQGFTLSKTSGDNQTTLANSSFSDPLAVTVTANNINEPIGVGGIISFTGPVSDASLATPSFTATTNSSGIVSVTVTANNEEGSYQVVASANGAPSSVNFSLTNTCDITVSNANDSGTGSLRQAIADVCAGSTITFSDNFTITLSSQLVIDKIVTVDGAGQSITINGNNAGQIFSIGSSGVVTLSHLTVANGAGSTVGALSNSGILTVIASTFRNSTSDGSASAIYNNAGNSVTLINSTFANNTSTSGATLYNAGTMYLNNITVSDSDAATAALANVSGSTLHLQNSLIANSTNADCSNSGTIATNTNTLIEDGSCSATISGDPRLAALGYYGGDTQTIALWADSAAINTGDNATCETSDQRGESRVNTCDIGAFESQGFTLAKAGGNNQHTVIQTSFANPLMVTITANKGIEPVGSDIQIDFAAPITGAGLSNNSFITALNSSATATATVIANSEMGSYVVSATAISQVVTFTLTNDCAIGLTVSNANPTGPGSLDHAVNNTCPNSTIDFASDYTIYLDNQLTIDRNLTIDGSTQTIILSGDSNHDNSRDVRPFYIENGTAVTLRSLTIISGTTANGSSCPNSCGGAIRNEGVLTAEQVIIQDNYTYSDGGGIYNSGGLLLNSISLHENSAVNSGGGVYASSSAQTTIFDSSISQNQSGNHGGGLYNSGGEVVLSGSTINQNATTNTGTGGGIRNWNGQITVLNSTISSNDGYQGGGIGQLGGAITLTNVTVVSNTTREGVFPDGGGIHQNSGSTAILNSIFAYHNGDNCFGTLTSAGHNLEDAATCTFIAVGDQMNTNPQLAPLDNYGGQTETHALQMGSAAINAANNSACSSTDQRGLGRLSSCDSGAFESQGFYLTLTGGDIQTATVNTAFSTPLQVTAAASDTNLTVGANHTIVFSGPSSGASLSSISVTADTNSAGRASASIAANNISGSYQVLATATGISNAISFSLVNDVPNIAPVLTAIGNQTITETVALTFTAIATDVDTEDILSYSLIAAPTGASIHPSSGLFSWTPTGNQGPNDYAFEVVVSDNGTPIESDRETIVVTVIELNTHPVLGAIGSRSGNEGQVLTFTATATDADEPAQTLSYSLNNAPNGATIGSSSGQFNWNPTESQGPDSYSFDVVVTDNGTPALSASETITIHVAELNTPPVLSALEAQTITATYALSFSVTATDADEPAQPLNYSLHNAPAGASINSGNGLFSWTPSKAQGETSYNIQVIVSDNGSPVLSDTATVLIEVVPVPTYTLAIHTSGAGSGQVNLNPAGNNYDESSIITLTATPNSGFYFGGWSGDLTSADTVTAITMDDHKVVTATFSAEPISIYTLTLNTVGNGSLNLNSGSYISGTVLSLSAIADNNWQFEGWSGDVNGDTNPTDIMMNTTKTITAIFSQTPISVVVDLSVGLMATASQVNPGDFVSYAISFANNSNNIATQVVISNTMPSGVAVTTVANSGTANVNHIGSIGHVERFEIDSLAPGESGLIAIAAQLQNPHLSGYFTSTATIESENTDSSLANNTASTAIVATNFSPTIEPIANRLVEKGEPISLTVEATDRNEESLIFTLSNPTIGATIDPHIGLFSWTPTQPGNFEITVMVEDTGTPPQSNSVSFMIRVKNTVTTLDPTIETTTTFPISNGITLAISVPVGAVNQSIELDYEPLPTASTSPADFSFAGVAFDLDAYIDNQAQVDFVFVEPVIFTLTYRDEDIIGLDESALQLYHFNETTSSWQTDGITVLKRDLANNQLIISVAHLTTFALFSTPDDGDPTHQGYLPVVIK